MTNTLEVENVYKTFPVAGSRALLRAVNGVSFTVRQGETVALVGESGSGKTTIGRCILGLAKVSSGSIRFNGKDITKGRRTGRCAAGSSWSSRSQPNRSTPVIGSGGRSWNRWRCSGSTPLSGDAG